MNVSRFLILSLAFSFSCITNSRAFDDIFATMRQEMNAVFDDLDKIERSSTTIMSYSTDVQEQEDEITITLKVPRIDVDNIEATLQPDEELLEVKTSGCSVKVHNLGTSREWVMLEISYKNEDKNSKEKQDNKISHTIISQGNRTQTFPCKLNLSSMDGIIIKCKDDVLTITIPKLKNKKNKQKINVITE